MQRQELVNNSTFENEYDIGTARIGLDHINYNKKHVGKTSIKQFT